MSTARSTSRGRGTWATRRARSTSPSSGATSWGPKPARPRSTSAAGTTCASPTTPRSSSPSCPRKGNELIKIHLTEGSAYIRVSQLALDKGVEIHTPDASFYVLEEGLYRFDVALDRDTRASVREGSLEAAAEDGSVLVRSQESVTAADGRLLGDPQNVGSREDGFDDWNGSRDAQLSARSERQYLPSEMGEYEEELDQNGQWVYEGSYGNVWVPNVSHYDDWRPYYYGRWVWYPIIGWTWVSSESWGWPVYHYGRWNWRFGLGWYWIPQRHWGPAWVHWWHDRDYIGWCPLTWYNRPGYLVDNRFYDRHGDRWFSAHNRAMTVVRRDHLQARDIGRRQVGRADLDRIDRVSLRAEQPTIRPAIDRSGPDARAAQRALSVRSGSRSAVRSVAPSSSLSPSRLRQGTDGSAVRSRGREEALSNSNRGAVARPSVRNSGADGRSVRTYPSQRTSGSRDAGGVSGERRSALASPARRSSTESGNDAARVSRSQVRTSETSRSTVGRDSQGTRTTERRSDSAVTRKSETVRSYPSTSRSGRRPAGAHLDPVTTSAGPAGRPNLGREVSKSHLLLPLRSLESVIEAEHTVLREHAVRVPGPERLFRAVPVELLFEPDLQRSPVEQLLGTIRQPHPDRAPPPGGRSALPGPRVHRRADPIARPGRAALGPVLQCPRSSSSSGRSVSAPRSSSSSSGRSSAPPARAGLRAGRPRPGVRAPPPLPGPPVPRPSPGAPREKADTQRVLDTSSPIDRGASPRSLFSLYFLRARWYKILRVRERMTRAFFSTHGGRSNAFHQEKWHPDP